MKGLILSGGAGTRLRPITYTSAKQLIPIANKPVLFYGIEALVAAGVTDLGIVVGETGAEVRAAVGDGSAFGAQMTYIQQDQPLGLAHAILISRDFLGNGRFIMYLGDNIILGGVTNLVRSFAESDANAHILLAKVLDPRPFGVAVVEGPRIVRLMEKPAEPPSDLAMVGAYLYDQHILEAAAAIRPSARGELEITEATQWLINRGYRVAYSIIDGWWKDTGRLEDILEANRIVLDRQEAERIAGHVDAASSVSFKVVIESGAEIIRSVVRGPVIIGRRTRIVNSYIGPFSSIQHDCRIEGCEIENSVILAETEIRNVGRRIEGSLIGRRVRVTGSERRPESHRFMLGDSSIVEIV